MNETKHTRIPWVAKSRVPGDPPMIGPLGAGNVCYLTANYGTETEEANARLIVAAVNMVAKHCSDPLKAAEDDVLGQALDGFLEIKLNLRRVLDSPLSSHSDVLRLCLKFVSDTTEYILALADAGEVTAQPKDE